MNILISPVGGQAIYGIVNYFKNKGFKVFGIDRNPEAIGKYFVDKFFKIPDVGTKGYVDSILKIISEDKIDFFISWLDPEIIFWNEKFYASEIPPDLTKIFAFNFSKNLLELCDKFKFNSLLKSKGFNSPETFLLSDIQIDNEKKLDFPALIKPRLGSGTKNTYLIENKEDFKYFHLLISNKLGANKFIIQKFIEGFEYTIDFFSENGKLKNLVVRKRLEHKGVSLRGEVVYNKQIEVLTNKFCLAFKINGLNNYQVIEHGNELFIIDYNPRPSGTIMLSINAGVDLLNNLIEQRQGKKITEYGQPRRLKMIRYLTELYYE